MCTCIDDIIFGQSCGSWISKSHAQHKKRLILRRLFEIVSLNTFVSNWPEAGHSTLIIPIHHL